MKNHKTLSTNPPIHIYINRLNNWLFFKIKDGYKNVPTFEVIEVVLMQCNLVNNQYQRKSEVLYIFTPNKSYFYLQNVKLSHLVFLKTYRTLILMMLSYNLLNKKLDH